MIRWITKPHGFGITLECETYRIGKYLLPAGTVYALYSGSQLVGRYPSADEAKKKAESLRSRLEHAAELPRTAAR